MSQVDVDELNVKVYASESRPDTFLFLPAEQAVDALDEGLVKLFGPPRFVLDLRLHPQRYLANADAATVLAQLHSKGYYLQLPPEPNKGASA